jgi:cell division septation protein DedD
METPTAAGTGAASSASAETAAATAAPSSSADSTTLAMATPPSSTGGRPEWLVNVDSFADPTRAQQLLDVLKGAGYPAALRTQLVQGVPSYRVVIPGLSTESEANTVVSDLEQHFELTSAWVLRTQ